jgi:hypothetical protein
MSSINHYDCLVNYAQQKNLPVFREEHFQQWSRFLVISSG